MKHHYLLRSILLCGVLLLSFRELKACHGLALVTPSFTVGTSDITINANSDPASCGCGPYYMEVEVVPSAASFSGTPPQWFSPVWGTAPWFHSLLNVPNYTAANGWPDNCVQEPYTALVIPFSALCSGTSFKVRAREYVAGSGSAGPWTTAYTFTTPGSPPTVSVSVSALQSSICFADSTILTASGSGCSGSYDYSWSPTTGLSNPFTQITAATPSVTTTYTVTFTDLGISQSATATITITVNSLPSGSATTMIESTCNGSNGSATVSASGGSPPYTYAWAPSGGSSATATGLAAGPYIVVITDQNNCFTAVPVVVDDSCDFVWPGDANDDAVADNFDILDIGIANGATGTTRAAASLSWYGQPSAPWGMTLLSGTDYKFVDCNGDGAINPSDTTAVILNYGYTHNNRYGASEFAGGAPDLAIVMTQDSITPSTAGSASINLGTAAINASSIYGIAFTVNFDPTQVDPNSITFGLPASWLGTPGNDLMAIKHVNGGSVDIAITRLDHNSMTGFGQIATLNFVTTGALTGTGNSALVPFTITRLKTVASSGGLITVNTVNDTLTVYDPAPLSSGMSGAVLQQFTLAPNPADGQFALSFFAAQRSDYKIEVINTLGQLVYASELKNVSGAVRQEIRLPENGEGIYLVRVSGGGAEVSGKVVCK